MTDSDRRNILLLAAGSAVTLLTTGLSSPEQRDALNGLLDGSQGHGAGKKTPETKPASKPGKDQPANKEKDKEFEAGTQGDNSYVLDPENPPKLDIKTKGEPNGTFIKVGKDTVLVAQSKDKKSWYAVSAICTHKACAVNFKPEDNCYLCPCHGSKFGVDGKVTKKPATADLTAYDVKEVKGKGGKKFVRVSAKA
jgi:Rieske Fe-S protein